MTDVIDTRTKAVVRFTKAGFHRWDHASTARRYLANPHRHLFHVEAGVELTNNDREIEFHDLLDFCQDHFIVMDTWSCEMAAENLLNALRKKWPDRFMSVGVFEDGECGAVITEEVRK
jgi:hypothetical protein